jgi:hypothetical protein
MRDLEYSLNFTQQYNKLKDCFSFYKGTKDNFNSKMISSKYPKFNEDD